MRIATAIVCVLAITAGAAYAETVKVSNANYGNLGWKTTLRVGVVGNNPSIAFQSRVETVPPYVEGLMCFANKSGTTAAAFGWSGLSKQITPGTRLDSITTLSIRTMHTQGVSPVEPTALYFGLVVDGVSHHIRSLPFATYGMGAQWTMAEYDLLGACMWYDGSDGVVRTWTDFLAAYPDAVFATEAESAAMPSSQNFNVFAGNAGPLAGERGYGRDARGMCDWVDIGFGAEEVTRYDFVVPEPSSCLALLTGILGALALRRKH